MPGLHGIEGHQNKNVAYRTAVPDLVLTAEPTIPAGDDVIVQWRATGTHLGEVNGIAPSGKPIDFSGITILTLRNGKITKQVIHYDYLSFLVQAGVLSDPRG